MAKPRPLVQVAAVCENVITEPDKVASLIRLVDTMYLTLPPGASVEKGEVGSIVLKLFVSLKSGEVRGEYDIDIVLRSPSGKKAPLPNKWHVSFVGEQAGAYLTLNFALPVRELGLYWFDVVWNGEVLTSVPLKLVQGEKPEALEVARSEKADLT